MVSKTYFVAQAYFLSFLLSLFLAAFIALKDIGKLFDIRVYGASVLFVITLGILFGLGKECAEKVQKKIPTLGAALYGRIRRFYWTGFAAFCMMVPVCYLSLSEQTDSILVGFSLGAVLLMTRMGGKLDERIQEAQRRPKDTHW